MFLWADTGGLAQLHQQCVEYIGIPRMLLEWGHPDHARGYYIGMDQVLLRLAHGILARVLSGR